MSENLIIAIVSVVAAIITKLPVLYGAFSRSTSSNDGALLELAIKELDERTKELEECQEQLKQRS